MIFFVFLARKHSTSVFELKLLE